MTRPFKTEQELNDYLKQFNRDIKPYHPETMETDEGLESDLQRKCNEWLDARGYPYIHDRSRKKNRKGKILDLHIYLPAGRHVVIELKVKGNKMSPEQLETFRKIQFLEHEIYQVKSFKRFLEIMEVKL
jgi:hypothetical protein